MGIMGKYSLEETSGGLLSTLIHKEQSAMCLYQVAQEFILLDLENDL